MKGTSGEGDVERKGDEVTKKGDCGVGWKVREEWGEDGRNGNK